jgi:hypothetical protein
MPPTDRPPNGLDLVIQIAQDFAAEAVERRAFERSVLDTLARHEAQEQIRLDRLEAALSRAEGRLEAVQAAAVKALNAETERHQAELERQRRAPLAERIADRVAGDTRTLLISVGVAAALALGLLGWTRADILAALTSILSSCAGAPP